MSGRRQLNWRNILFLCLSPLAAVIGIAFYVSSQGMQACELACFAIMMVLTGLSITAGYHRYYGHRSYECHPIIQIFYLLFGAAALQAPVLRWVHDHRDHHRFVDRDEDPYSISRGFWWAHIGWTFFKSEEGSDGIHREVPDLASNTLLIWQERYHVLLGLLVGLGFPLLIGLSFGRPWGGVLWGGILRVVVAHHGTFLVNSVGHFFGRQPYSTRNSSRDSTLLALLTLGEGYHNFHHAFPRDYRNGIRLYHWDPTKWWISALEAVGLAWRLQRTRIDRVRWAETRQLARNGAAFDQ